MWPYALVKVLKIILFQTLTQPMPILAAKTQNPDNFLEGPDCPHNTGISFEIGRLIPIDKALYPGYLVINLT